MPKATRTTRPAWVRSTERGNFPPIREDNERGRRKRLRQEGVWFPVVQYMYCTTSGSGTVSAAPFTPSRAEVFQIWRQRRRRLRKP
jgi:hypothetical protein